MTILNQDESNSRMNCTLFGKCAFVFDFSWLFDVDGFTLGFRGGDAIVVTDFCEASPATGFFSALAVFKTTS